MTEREKIIEILKQTSDIWAKEESCGYIVSVDFGKIADALIAANIGDATAYKAEAEYWEKICKFESDEYHTTIKNAAEHACHIMQERDEYKHRAEVAERAFNNTIKTFQETLFAFFPDEEIDLDKWKKQNLANAEKELAEEEE